MKTSKIKVARLTAMIVLLIVLYMIVAGYKFPIFDSAETVGIETTEFLWSYRLIDLLAQAFVLFASAACCVTVLRAEKNQ